MSTAKNAVLLALGGVAGACCAAALMSPDAKETARACRSFSAMDRLTETLRREGEAALAACRDETERAAVCEKIRAAAASLREELHDKGRAFTDGLCPVNRAETDVS